MLELLGLGELFSQPYSLLGLLLLVAVLWLLRITADLRNELTAVKRDMAHTISSSFLSDFCTENNRQLLGRVRDSVVRTRAKVAADGGGGDALGHLASEIDSDMGRLSASFGGGPRAAAPPPPHAPPAGVDDDLDDDPADF